jgi:hypothetical protein
VHLEQGAGRREVGAPDEDKVVGELGVGLAERGKRSLWIKRLAYDMGNVNLIRCWFLIGNWITLGSAAMESEPERPKRTV